MITQYNFFKTWLQMHAKTERGASLVEYALLVALIAVVCIGAVGILGGSIKGKFEETDAGLNSVPAP